MKKIIGLIVLCLVVLIGCDIETIEPHESPFEKGLESVEEVEVIIIEEELIPEGLSCARRTFMKFNLTNENPEAETLSRIMRMISFGSDDVNELEKLNQYELAIFIYHINCINSR